MSAFAPVNGLSREAIEELITRLLAEATLEEKVAMMSGTGFIAQFEASGRRWGADPYRAGGGIDRLGVEPFYFSDGPRGVARGNSTCFPCTMARGASFDADLERRIGEAMGIELRAQGCTLSGAVCVNLLRHPAWGRAQETYGEDSHHLGVMGAALGLGIQTHNVAATVKHLALNSIENARFKVDVQIDERSLHEIYLPHFKHIVDAGVLTVMSAYNKMNGAYCGENAVLLTDILRGEWGFDGFVHSDWVLGVYTVEGANAGLDVENPEPRVFGRKLVAAVQDGRVSEAVIDRACRRILRIWYRIRCADDPQDYGPELVAQHSHRTLALEAAEKSAVLLANDGILPLDAGRIRKLAVLGRLAGLKNTGDKGSSRVRPPYVATPLEGLQRYLAALGKLDAIVSGDESDIAAASAAAADADAIIVVAGYTAEEEGEYVTGDMTFNEGQDGQRLSFGGDRDSLDLPAAQIELIAAAAATGKPVIVILVAGSAVMVEDWHEPVAAILQTFYSGMDGGTALARLLFGDVSPSGRLPFTVARDSRHYPFFDKNADAITYDYWHGYAKFAEEGLVPRYPFGHGLGYSPFSYSSLAVEQGTGGLEVTVTIRNDGTIAAEEVVQCYVGYPGAVRPRAKAGLKAFTRIALAPGESGMAQLHIPLDSLRYRDPADHGWKLERGKHRIIVARFAGDNDALQADILL